MGKQPETKEVDVRGRDAELFELVVKTGKLPTKLTDLRRVEIIGRKLSSMYAKALKTARDIGAAKDMEDRALRAGQQAARIMLEARDAIGRILEGAERRPGKGGGPKKPSLTEPPEEHGGKTSSTEVDEVLEESLSEYQEKLRELGMSRQDAQRAITIHRHPEEVETAVLNYGRQKKIPTITAVLNAIKSAEEQKTRKRGKRIDVSRKLRAATSSVKNWNFMLSGGVFDVWEEIDSTARVEFLAAAQKFVGLMQDQFGEDVRHWKIDELIEG